MYKRRSKQKYLNFISSFFIIIFFTQTSTFAQDSILNHSISLEIKTTTISKALKQLEKKINYYFTYDNKIIDKEKEIELSLKNKSLKDCLNLILKDKNLSYQVIENNIVITKTNNSSNIEISSFVLDKNTKQPLQFANISLKNINLGTITNDKGEFILKIPKKFINDKICISYIGYKNICIDIENAANKNIIYLEEKIISLQEILITRSDPVTIIKSAIQKIETNYFTKPISYSSFYRESVKKRKKFMSFSEAVLKVYKPALSSYKTGQIKVLKARKMQNISKIDTVSLKLKSGLKSSLDLDIIKNRIDFINEKYLKFYDYKMLDIVSFDDKTVYEIEFTPKENANGAIYKGSLYISVDDLAIVGALFSVSKKKIKKANVNFIVKKDRKLIIKIIDTKYRVSYKFSNNKYYINHILASLKMKVKKRKKIFSIIFETSFEMAVIKIDTVSVQKIKRKEISKLNTVFIDDFTKYDYSFWENYNYLKPNEPWQEAIKKFKLKALKQ